MPLKFQLFSVLALGLLVLSGCTYSAGGSERLVGKRNAKTQSCEFRADEGDQAQMNLLSEVGIKTALFEKEYNSSLLAGVLSASVTSSIEFISKTGLSLYKASAISTKECSRSLFGTLPDMPADISENIKASVEKTSGVILGVYFPKDEKGLSGLVSTQKKAALVLRENTNRWTLLHEFMHHLFKSRAQEKGVVAKEQELKMEALQKQFDEVRFDTSTSIEQKIEKLTALFVQYAEVMDAIAIFYPLEEVAIEILLKKEFAQGRLKYAPLNGDSYIIESLKQANQIIDESMQFGINIMEQAEILGRTELVDQLMFAVNNLSERATQISDLYNKYDERQRANEHVVGVVSTQETKSHENHSGCGHGQEFAEISNKVKKLKNLKF